MSTDPRTNPEYFTGPDAYGTEALWRIDADRPSAPQVVIEYRDLDDAYLWAKLTAGIPAENQPRDDGSPCCIAFVTSGGSDHIPGCAG